MIIHGRIQKSKKRKVPKAVQAQNELWLQNLEKLTPNFSRKTVRAPVKPFSFTAQSFRRDAANSATIPL